MRKKIIFFCLAFQNSDLNIYFVSESGRWDSNHPNSHSRHSWRQSRPRPSGSTTSDRAIKLQETLSDSTAKYTVPSITNPTLNQNVYFQVKEIEGTFAVIKSDFKPNKKINFFSDEMRYGWVTPRKGVHLEQLPSNTSATASFSSGSCSACYHDGKSHSINMYPKIYVIGDEHIPAALGVGGDCAAVIRVDNGDFHQAKAVLLHHLRCGLRIDKGSIIVTFLLTHLFRSGYSKYWEDFQNFSSWAINLLKISVLPGIPPYQIEQSDSDLISLGQVYSHLQGAYLGVGAAPNNQTFMMWKPFLDTMEKYGAGTVEVPVPPIHLKEIGMYFKCSTTVQAGIDVNGNNGLPAEVMLYFFNSVFNSVRSSNLARNLQLPNFESLQNSLYSNKQHGKKIFCYGTSILRNITHLLKPMCDSKGIELHSDCLGGDFLQRFKTIDLEELKCANKQDILILSWLGNRLLNTENCKPMKTGDGTTYHTIGAVIPTDIDVDYTVVETGRTIRKLATIFPGRTYFLGPFPRHISPCCSSADHTITGPNNNSIDMLKYTHAYSTYICGAPGVITNNVTYVHSTQIFGNNFDANMLMDGVHPSKDANHTTAEFIINLLSENLKPTTSHLHNMDFSEHLALHGVLAPDISADSQQLSANLHNQHITAGSSDLETEPADH